MDIHRCRFVPYNPQSINALAFSHPASHEIQGRGFPTLRLAIGRANGDIEIWNPLRGTWLQESIFRGGKDRSIEGLAWTLDPSETVEGKEVAGRLRLFSIGYSSVVTEWDLETSRPARHSSGNYGEIWCLAAQPRWKPLRKTKDGQSAGPAEGEYTGQHLAVGCADGTIVILSTEDGDLKYLKTIRPSTKRARVLSITFQNRHTVVAGYADSSIRVFDIRSGNLLRTISMGKGQDKDTKELLVWSVKCLPDSSIVSGDSAGEVRIFDGKNYSLVQRLQGHQADVLDVAVSADGESIVSGGADQRTVIYRLKRREKNVKTRRWAEVMHRRYHTHDVKALAVFETVDMSVVVSGGLDTIPVVLPLKEYGKEHHRKLPNLPQIPQLSTSDTSRLLMSWWDREVNIWRVAGSSQSDTEQHKLVGKILFQGEEHLTSAALSRDGTILVAATVSEVKVFSLTPDEDDDVSSLQVHKLDISSQLSSRGAKNVAISPDCKWICLVRPNNDIYLAKVSRDPEAEESLQIQPKLQKVSRLPRHKRGEKALHGSLGAYDRMVRSLSFSGDSRILACGDLAGFVDVWTLQDNVAAPTAIKAANDEEESSSDDDSDSDSDEEDSSSAGERWKRASTETPLPRLNSSVLLMSFRPALPASSTSLSNGRTSRKLNTNASESSASDDRLMVLTADHHLTEFNVLQGKLSDWSRRNPKACLPEEFTVIKDRAMGAIWDIAGGQDRLWLYGPSWLWMFDLSQDFPNGETRRIKARKNPSPSKRKRVADEEHGNEGERKKKRNTGAGDGVILSEAGVGFGKVVRKIVGEKETEAEVLSLENRKNENKQLEGDDGDDDDGELDELTLANEATLASLRRQQLSGSDEQTPNGKHISNGVEDENNQVAKLSTPEPESDHSPEQQRQWWSTFKYREILGIVPLSHNSQSTVESAELSGAEDARAMPLEVVVVERPIWDVDLPDLDISLANGSFDNGLSVLFVRTTHQEALKSIVYEQGYITFKPVFQVWSNAAAIGLSTPYCIICGALIHSRTRKSPWMAEFRAVRVIPGDGQPFLTGVGIYRHRNALLSAPLSPHERYDDSGYRESRSDEFVSQGRTSADHPFPGFVFHDACWGILKALMHPHEIPMPCLYDICQSFPSQTYGQLTWGHGYGNSHSDTDTSVHGRPENYQQPYFLRNPLDIPELQEALLEAERGRDRDSLVECSVVSEKVDSDLFYRLPVEIREEIQCLLSSNEVARLRTASRSFASMPLSQKFWRSRFLPFFERGFVFEPVRHQQDTISGAATIRYDWKALYEKTDPSLAYFEALRNRRRVWECNKPLAELLLLHHTLDGGGVDAMDEHNHVVWRTVAVKSPKEQVRGTSIRQGPAVSSTYTPPSILKELAIRVPARISQIAVSLVYFNGNTYVSGIRINTPDQKETRLGYIHPTQEIILDTRQPGGSGPLDLTGFAICADPGGIRGIKAALAKGHWSTWAGDHENVPNTLRLCLDERITHLKATFDAFRMVSLSVPEEEQIHNQNPPCLSARKAALWYPDIPSEDQFLHEIDFVGQYDSNPSPLTSQQPLIRLMFGGQQGNYLKYLTKISVSTLAGILTWIDFHYDCDDAPVRSLSVFPNKARDSNQSKIQFTIDGPGGERVTGFRVKDKQWWTPKNEPIHFSITTLVVSTNRGRTFTFDANVLPKIRLPLGTHMQQKKQKLTIEPDSTITGVYVTHDTANGLTGFGVISEKLLG
ncbi:U3 small nucleolar RNA-associated protein 4 [Arthroderma uncinatum]|uniref:U3 small nucleolar RNA-associated protein 4 n=1 Tax=Arthroderma uncinatum TaxID=74035 RepID=UPI00144AC5B2|nr:U3 small nucleolar RNA-associated protein 4 [Arthroderma uncinatum]KAF3480620.1 U3 small nucleolar RNA-associated protein 4 [Arthroderma uncinatum]